MSGRTYGLPRGCAQQALLLLFWEPLAARPPSAPHAPPSYCCHLPLHGSARARRILTKLPGVTAVETDVAAKAVAVTLADGAETSQEALLEALLKWGKAAGKEVALAGQ